LVAENGFDAFVGNLHACYWLDTTGRTGVPPRDFFWMFFLGTSRAGSRIGAIAWRRIGSRSLGDVSFARPAPSVATP
jgi:hypothetical protein